MRRHAQIAQRLAREAAAGNAQSQYQLGRMNAAGFGGRENMTEARRLFVAAANQGHIEGSAYGVGNAIMSRMLR